MIVVLNCKQMKLPEIQKIMREFEKESEIMDMKDEMMGDAIDEALGGDEDEEERLLLLLYCENMLYGNSCSKIHYCMLHGYFV